MAKKLVFGICVLLSFFMIGFAYWAKSIDIKQLPPLIEVIGNLHPLILHLPIGAFIYLFIVETWNLLVYVKFRKYQIRGSLPILFFGTLSSVFASVAGLTLYLRGDYVGEIIDSHLNWGIAFCISAIFVLFIALSRGINSLVYRILLIASTIIMSVAGHFGGLITHGDPLKPLFTEDQQRKSLVDINTISSYQVVDKILQQNCYACHAIETKKKGGLLMDSYAALIDGGKNGNTLVAGDLNRSKMSSYLHLPLEDDLHMPPEGKAQLDENEIAFIDAWIIAGAHEFKKLSDDQLKPDLFEWATRYMAETEANIPKVAVDSLGQIPVDISNLITQIEIKFKSSITYIGTVDQKLFFTAVNSIEDFDDAALQSLIPIADYLVEIDLSRTKVTSNSLKRLLKHTNNLEKLNLSYTQLGTQWIHESNELDKLETLNLYANNLNPLDMESLRQFTQLKSLYVGSTGLKAHDLGQLKSTLPHVQIVGDDYFK